MKHRLNFIGIFFLSFAGLIFLSFHEPNMLKDFDLKGKVKKVILNDYSATRGSDGKMKRGPWIDSTVYEFNEDGKLIAALSYHGQKKPNGHEFYTYDKDGHLSFHVKRYLNTTSDSSFYMFRNGLLVEKNSFGVTHDQVKEHIKTIFTYKMDQITGEISIRENGDTITKILNAYNEQGKIAKVIYSEMGKNKTMETKATKTYSYNESGLLTGTNESEADGSSIVNTWQYNAQGDVISLETINSIFALTTYYEYEYDKMGNWIKRTSSFSQGETESVIPEKTPQSIATRTIVYY
ncbi:MAG TPA: hypothetical protein VFJ43_05885 [Bacteroidia bacterium]|nr:hypothetical protein [Bacteroidia bacterium]